MVSVDLDADQLIARFGDELNGGIHDQPAVQAAVPQRQDGTAIQVRGKANSIQEAALGGRSVPAVGIDAGDLFIAIESEAGRQAVGDRGRDPGLHRAQTTAADREEVVLALRWVNQIGQNVHRRRVLRDVDNRLDHDVGSATDQDASTARSERCHPVEREGAVGPLEHDARASQGEVLDGDVDAPWDDVQAGDGQDRAAIRAERRAREAGWVSTTDDDVDVQVRLRDVEDRFSGREETQSPVGVGERCRRLRCIGIGQEELVGAVGQASRVQAGSHEDQRIAEPVEVPQTIASDRIGGHGRAVGIVARTPLASQAPQ